MKYSEYWTRKVAEEMKETLDTQHDTIYGAFCKGAGFIMNNGLWIGDKMPEEFEDMMESETKSMPVAICCKDTGVITAHRVRRGSVWAWDAPNEVIKWRKI